MAYKTQGILDAPSFQQGIFRKKVLSEFYHLMFNEMHNHDRKPVTPSH